MTRFQLLIASLICWSFGGAPALANADDAPCAAEAAAVKKMKKRDPSLRYPKDADAMEHVEAGRRAFGVQQYDQAIEKYTAAGLADDAPLILYNLGQTYRAAKDYERAIRQYQLFLERGAPGKQVRALVECHIKTMNAEMDHAASTAPPTGPAPDQNPTAQTAVTPDPEPDPVPSDPVTAYEANVSRWTTTRTVSVGVAAAGVIALGAGLVFGLQAADFREDAARVCPASPCGNADEANLLSDGADRRALYSNVSLGAGVSMIAGAAVLWYVGAPSSSRARPDLATVVPHVTPTFAGLAFSTRF